MLGKCRCYRCRTNNAVITFSARSSSAHCCSWACVSWRARNREARSNWAIVTDRTGTTLDSDRRGGSGRGYFAEVASIALTSWSGESSSCAIMSRWTLQTELSSSVGLVRALGALVSAQHASQLVAISANFANYWRHCSGDAVVADWAVDAR